MHDAAVCPDRHIAADGRCRRDVRARFNLWPLAKMGKKHVVFLTLPLRRGAQHHPLHGPVTYQRPSLVRRES